MSRRTAVPALLVVAAVLSGCTDAGPDDPAPEDFAAGACRSAAPAVLTIGDDVAGLGDDAVVPTEVKQSLKDAQTSLADAAAEATGRQGEALEQLVVAVGFLRLRADGNTYERSVGDEVRSAYDSVLMQCASGTAPAE